MKKDNKDSKKSKSKSLFTGACYETHPACQLGGGVIYGGSAHSPKVKDADIYVALESSAKFTLTDPWEPHQIVNVRFNIDDSYPPKKSEVPRFKKMVTYLCNQLQAGKKIHIGCIGGHGRTGTVLAAMAAELGHKDAIQYVRKHYCAKAVESAEQVEFLMDHYGANFAEANKTYTTSLADLKDYKATGTYDEKYGSALWKPPASSGNGKLAAIKSQEVLPLPSDRNLWKKS